MQQRNIGTSALGASRIVLGTMTFGDQVDEATATKMVDHCIAQEINFIDTANVYNAGRTEEILGRVLKGRRGQVVLASKVGIKMGDGPDEKGLSRAAIMKAIDDSLRRLGTDYLDLYYLHQPDHSTPIEESLGAMDELVRAGKIRELAASNYASWQVTQMLWLAHQNSWRAVRASQHMHNLIARGVEQEFLPMCAQFSISTVAYNPLAGGLLTGKHRTEAPKAGTRFDRNALYRDRYWHDENFDVVRDLTAIARDSGRTLVSLSLNWLLHHTPTDFIIVGASKVDQLDENLAALKDGPLPADTVAACDELWKRLRGPTPIYNR